MNPPENLIRYTNLGNKSNPKNKNDPKFRKIMKSIVQKENSQNSFQTRNPHQDAAYDEFLKNEFLANQADSHVQKKTKKKRFLWLKKIENWRNPKTQIDHYTENDSSTSNEKYSEHRLKTDLDWRPANEKFIDFDSDCQEDFLQEDIQLAQKYIEHPSLENLEESKSSQKDDSFDWEEFESDGEWAWTGAEEYFGINYIKNYNKILEDDMKKFHTQNEHLRKEVQEIYKCCYEELNQLSEWKLNANKKIKNYKLVIKVLMRENDELIEEKQNARKSMNSKMEELKNEHKDRLEKYIEAQNEWESYHKDELNQLKTQFNSILEQKEHEYQNNLISLEGELEDLNHVVRSLDDEKSKVISRWKAEIKLITQKDIEISVRACMTNMLDILELKDQNSTQKKIIKSLQRENENLKRSKSEWVKRFIAPKNIKPLPKFNMSDISLSSNLSKNKIAGKKKFKLNGSKLKISKGKIVVGDKRPEIGILKKEVEELCEEKARIKGELYRYSQEFRSIHNRKPSQADPTFLMYHQKIMEIDSKIQTKELEIKKQEELALKQLKSRSVSPSNGVFNVIRKSRF
jgi:hypothetical protein